MSRFVNGSGLPQSDQLAGWLGVSLDKMPPVVESTYVIGEVTEAAATATGLTVGTAVVAGAGGRASARMLRTPIAKYVLPNASPTSSPHGK